MSLFDIDQLPGGLRGSQPSHAFVEAGFGTGPSSLFATRVAGHPASNTVLYFRPCGNAKKLRCSVPLDGVQPGEGHIINLFRRNTSASKVCELDKLMLNSLQPFTPLSVSDLNTYSVPAVMPKLLI
jgi:hypothetical protein